MIVEHLYMWPCVGSIHVWLLSRGRRGRPDKIFHSRFLDLRIEVCTEPPTGSPARRVVRFVHLIPQFLDNYSYLVVDAVEVELPQNPGEAAPTHKTLYFAVLVDPADTVALEAALQEINDQYYHGQLNLQMVLTTHKHWSVGRSPYLDTHNNLCKRMIMTLRRKPMVCRATYM